MRVLVTRHRMAMREPAYAYDVRVPLEETPEHNRGYDVNGNSHTKILIDRTEHGGDRFAPFLSFEDATTPEEQRAMPQGIERYDARLAHDAGRASAHARDPTPRVS